MRADESADGRTDGQAHMTNLTVASRCLADDLINRRLDMRKSTPASHNFSSPREHRPVFGTPCSNKVSALYIVASGVSV